MAIRRTRAQKEQAQLRQEKGLMYHYSTSASSQTQQPVKVKSSLIQSETMTTKKVKQLLMNDPKFIAQDLNKTLLVTAIILVILAGLVYLNYR